MASTGHPGLVMIPGYTWCVVWNLGMDQKWSNFWSKCVCTKTRWFTKFANDQLPWRCWAKDSPTAWGCKSGRKMGRWDTGIPNDNPNEKKTKRIGLVQTTYSRWYNLTITYYYLMRLQDDPSLALWIRCSHKRYVKLPLFNLGPTLTKSAYSHLSWNQNNIDVPVIFKCSLIHNKICHCHSDFPRKLSHLMWSSNDSSRQKCWRLRQRHRHLPQAPGHPSAAASRVPWIWRPPDLIQKIEQTSIIIIIIIIINHQSSIIIIKSRDINSSVVQWDTIYLKSMAAAIPGLLGIRDKWYISGLENQPGCSRVDWIELGEVSTVYPLDVTSVEFWGSTVKKRPFGS